MYFVVRIYSTALHMTGDWSHVALILNASIFAYAVVVHNGSNIFDPVWRPEGFCVMNRDIPYWNSHDLCLYFDTAASVAFGLLYIALKNSPGMESANDLVKFGILGTFGHGLGHGAISKALREGKIPDDTHSSASVMSDMPWTEAVVMLLPFLVFWIFLLKASMPQASLQVLLPMTLVSLVFNIMTPPQFGFTYVQTVLLLAFSLNQLLRPQKDKDFAYALYPIVVGLPLSEYCLCD